MRALIAEETEEDRKLLSRKCGLGDELCEGFNQVQLDRLLEEFGDTFSDTPGCYTGGGCNIQVLEGSQPVNLPVRRVPFQMREGVEQALQSMLQGGIIEPAEESAAWCSLIVPVRKPDGTIRICVDYRGLNEVTTLQRHYMPTLEELLDRAGASKVLTMLDLTAGFQQVAIEPDQRDLMTFGSPKGRFRFRRMPFELKNAPAQFQMVVDKVLEECRAFASCYIDDTLVFSDDWESHLEALRLVFKCLSEAGLTVKKRKCCFGRNRLRYSGHWIGNEELRVPRDRVEALASYGKPKRKRQLKSFLGVIGYYRKFVRHFAEDAAVLTPMTTKVAPELVRWTGEAGLAFHHLRESLCNYVVLIVPVPGDCYVLYTDASYRSVGGCLHVVWS